MTGLKKMAVSHKMLPGYNHNICYKGQIFHIQTEDSGVDNPHIITLLYIKGNIIGRKKHDYKDIIGFDRLEDVVRELMQDQHKSMLRDLKSGQYDRYLGVPGPAPEAAAACPAPGEAPPPAAPPPPPPPEAAHIKEKPAVKTITISEDEELKDEDIFGADIISDRSLDEVILSFLSKSLEEDD